MTVDVAPREIRVAFRYTHPDAVTEACRRLQVMHEKWPEQPWRIRIRRITNDRNYRRPLWVLYAITPKGTWT